MSLVDYASSDDDVSEEEVRDNKENEPEQVPQDDPRPPIRPQTQAVVSSYQRPQSTAHSSAPSVEKLPDASLLLNSPVFSSNMLSVGDHSSHVAAAMAESASRKRESNASASNIPRSKVPRGNLPHSKNIPDTVGGMLVPPQLSGSSSQVPVQLDTTKRKLRGLGFSRQEDILLVQGWLATGLEVVQIKGQPKSTYWGRVAEYFHNYKTFASDREDKSLQQRWSYIQVATKKFCECITQVENDHKNGVNQQDKFFYAKQLYEKLEKKKFYFDHCWRLLKDTPKWVEDMQKHKRKPSNRGKRTTISPESSSPSSSESLIDLVENNGPNIESGNKERPPVRTEVPVSDLGNMERPPMRVDVPSTGFVNMETPLVRTDVPNTDSGNRPPTRKDVPNTDFGRPPVRADVLNTDFVSMETLLVRTDVPNSDFGNRPPVREDVPNTDFGNMERSEVRTDAANTVFGNMERLPIRTEVPATDFGLAERPQLRKAEKLKVRDYEKSDNASKQVVDLLHTMEEWRDQANKEKKKYRRQKLEILRERLEMDRERLRLEREDKEERIMLMNISVMPPELQQYYHRRRMEILARGMKGV